MYIKIALRNVKRQLGNYLVYFTTVALTIALMFSFCNLIFSQALQKAVENMKDIKDAMTGVTVFVCIVTAFVLAYAAVYMLGLRKKEFGTYLTLGMKRRDILKLFSLETLLISVAAAATGLTAGLFIYQGLSAILCRLLGTEISLSSYSPRGLLLTIVLTAAMFAFSLLVSARYLRKVTVHELLSGEKHERETKHAGLWGVLAVASFAGMGISFYTEYKYIVYSMLNDKGVAILPPLAAMCACLFVFHMAFSKAVGALLLRNKKLCAKGTNAFVFRQLSSKMSVNAVIFGILGLILTFTVIGTNMCFTEKISKEHYLDRETPFDITARFSVGNENGIPFEEGKKIIEKYSPVTSQLQYSLYTSGKNEIGAALSHGDEDFTDSYMPLSQFNTLITKAGYEPIELENSFFTVSAVSSDSSGKLCDTRVTFGNKTYSSAGTVFPLYDVLYGYSG